MPDDVMQSYPKKLEVVTTCLLSIPFSEQKGYKTAA